MKNTVSQNKKLNKYLQSAKNTSGMTLVEMVVTFALLSIFMVSVSQVISSGMSLYYHVKGVAYGKQVTDTLMEKITGELEDGNGDTFLNDEENVKFFISENKSEITFMDKANTKIKIGVNTANYLNIFYNQTDVVGAKEINWIYDQKVYMGYTIKTLQFTQVSKEDTISDSAKYSDNIIQVKLTVESPRYGEYSQTRYVEMKENGAVESGVGANGPGNIEELMQNWGPFISNYNSNNNSPYDWEQLQSTYGGYIEKNVGEYTFPEIPEAYIKALFPNYTGGSLYWKPYPIYQTQNNDSQYSFTVYYSSTSQSKPVKDEWKNAKIYMIDSINSVYYRKENNSIDMSSDDLMQRRTQEEISGLLTGTYNYAQK